jgi:hypothetical protein
MIERYSNSAAAGLLSAVGLCAQAQAGIATVTNPDVTQSGKSVLVYQTEQAVNLPPHEWMEVDAGDLVTTLEGGSATVTYDDGCTIELPGNSRLPITGADATSAQSGSREERSDESCEERAALLLLGSGGQAIGGAGLTAAGATLSDWPVIPIIGAGVIGWLVADTDGDGDGSTPGPAISPASF